MKRTLKYKGFIGNVNGPEKDGSMGGKLLNVNDAYVTYVGENYEEMVKDFYNAVDDYIEYKNEKNKESLSSRNHSSNVLKLAKNVKSSSPKVA